MNRDSEDIDWQAARRVGTEEGYFSVKSVDRRLSRPCLGQFTVVLDVGGSSGIDAAPMAATAELVVVLDIDTHALQRGKNAFHAEKIQYVCGAGDRLPFRDNVFGLLTCFSVLDHFPTLDSVRGAVREFERVLMPYGRAAVTVPNLVFLPVTFLMFLRKLIGKRVRYEPENWRFRPKDLHKLLTSSNLRPVLYDGAFPTILGKVMTSWLFSTEIDDHRIRMKVIVVALDCLTGLITSICASKLLAPRFGILAVKVPALSKRSSKGYQVAEISSSMPVKSIQHPTTT